MSDLPPPMAEVTRRLAAAGCVAADEEAAELVAGAADTATLEAWLQRREQGEPLAWITGSLWFCGRALRIDAGVYVPRRQTEELARQAALLLPPRGWAADLCTGAGAVAVHLMAEVPTARVIGTELDARAAASARRNGVHVVIGDLDGPLRAGHRFDLVTAVAPYVPTDELAFLPRDVQRFEPRLALDGGADGLDVHRRVVSAAGRLLRPGGWLLVELGGRQDEWLRPDLAAAGFGPAVAGHDDDGDLRTLAVPYGAASSTRPRNVREGQSGG